MRAMRKSERKLTIREQAKRKVRPPAVNIGANKQYREDVEAGRRELNTLASEGGDSHAKKIRAELLYLLNNYLPTYDPRINQLMDEWRRSGDPTYDPSVRVKLRQARREYMEKTNAV